MHRIYKAARKCGYLENTIEPIDSRDEKIYLETKLFICAQEVKESQWEP